MDVSVSFTWMAIIPCSKMAKFGLEMDMSVSLRSRQVTFLKIKMKIQLIIKLAFGN